MKIDTIIEVLNYLNLDYQVIHTNDYSQVIIPTNNGFRDRSLLFDCGDRNVYNNDFVILEEENENSSSNCKKTIDK